MSAAFGLESKDSLASPNDRQYTFFEDRSTEFLELQVSDNSDNEEEHKELEYAYLKGFKLLSAIVALALSILLIALDQGIVATAVPKITDEFNAIDDIGWYGSGYLLMTVSQLLFGKLYTIYPMKPVFLISIVIFEIGSAICGAAPSSPVLIFGRVIAGLGGSGVFSGVFILLAHIVPVSKRPLYAGLAGVTYGLGTVIGPLLGGIFTDKLSWRWCFYINLPIGALAALLVFWAIHQPRSSGKKPTNARKTLAGLDSVGILLLLIALACLLLVLQWGGLRYAWDNARVVVLLVIFAALTVGFFVIQHWVPAEYSSVPPQIVRQRSVAAGCIYFIGWGGGFMPIIYLLPIWFQTVKSASAFQSGIMTIPLVLAQVIASVVGGVGVTVVGYYTPVFIISSMLMVVGAGLISSLNVESGPAQWIGFQIVYGIGLGLGADLPLVAAQTVLPLDEVPRATALLVLCQTLSATVFISVCQSVFENRLLLHLQHVLPSISADDLLNMGVVDILSSNVTGSKADLLGAYSAALSESFIVSIVLAGVTMVGSLAMEWKSVKSPVVHSPDTK